MARKFLYAVAILITLAVVGMISFSFFGGRIMQGVLVPRVSFAAPPPLASGHYRSAEAWLAHPGLRTAGPAGWLPTGAISSDVAPAQQAAIFYVHPTSAFDTARWNASPLDPVASAQAARFLRMQATALTGAGRLWAPRYRQAVFGAFLTDKPAAERAKDVAYGDVKAAFEAFLTANPQGPLILAAHSQGSLHLLRLLSEGVGGAGWHDRVVAIYAPGWPISVEHDLPRLGFPACTGPGQSGCLLSWQSFAPPADPAELEAAFDAGTGFDGVARKGSTMLCTNPLTGGASGLAAPSTNLGVLVGDGEPASTQLMKPGFVGARCTGRGILLIDQAHRMGPAVMPGNNYHAYDYSLFWANIRADAVGRLAAWRRTH